MNIFLKVNWNSEDKVDLGQLGIQVEKERLSAGQVGEIRRYKLNGGNCGKRIIAVVGPLVSQEC